MYVWERKEVAAVVLELLCSNCQPCCTLTLPPVWQGRTDSKCDCEVVSINVFIYCRDE